MTNKKPQKTKFEEFLAIFKNKKVIIAVVTTIALLILFRIGSVIPMPFVTIHADSSAQQNSFLEMVNLLGGGGLTQVSMFAIGISPYITAQIIMQLLSSELIPPLSRLAKSGERGRKKIEVYTRVLTLPLAAIQAYAIIELIRNNSNFVKFSSSMPFGEGTPLFFFFYIILMLSGTYIAIFLGDIITKRGVGNGITLIILAGILGSLFSSFQTVFLGLKQISGTNAELTSVISFIVYIAFYILLLIAVVFINGSIRKIPIQQVGQSLTKNPEELSYLPIKVNAVGVIPVIFASSIMTIPSTVAQFLPTDDSGRKIIEDYVSLNSGSGIAIYFVLIIFFTFFYSYVQLNPQKISEDFKKSGRFIPGIKMGRDTEKHITKTLYRINWIGAPFLAIIATIPYIVSIVSRVASNGTVMIPSGAALGGTGIVIMVAATIDFWQSIKSTATTTSYSYQRKEIESIISDKNETKDLNDDSQLW